MAATLTFSDSAPTIDGADIANFTGAAQDRFNILGDGITDGPANDAGTYVAFDRGAQGQTFMTGANAGNLNSVTLRIVGYTSSTATGNNASFYNLSNTSSSFTIRISSVAGTALTLLSTETAASGGPGPANPGTGSSTNGPGTYLTFTLATAVPLLANTVYAFDVAGSTAGAQNTRSFFETLGINSDVIANSQAFTVGTNAATQNGNTATLRTGDRVFHADISPVPEPSTLFMLMGGFGAIALLRRRRA